MPSKTSLCLAIFFMLISAGCVSNKVKKDSSVTKEPLYFIEDITYQDESQIKPEVLAECQIQENLRAAIHKQSAKNGLPLSTTAQLRKLSVTIIDATPGVFVFGNFGSVPATLDIKFSVSEGDKILLEETKHCKTNLAGFMGLQPSACNKIEKCAQSQGTYVAERISRILYK
jgi:hypothetical protein